MRIFAGVPRVGASNDSGVVVVEDGNSIFIVFTGYLLENFKQSVWDYVYLVCRTGQPLDGIVSDPQMHDLQ